MIQLQLEDFKTQKNPKNTKSKAHQQAIKLGLEYYGFGRYGKNSKLTHYNQDGKLMRYRDPKTITKYHDDNKAEIGNAAKDTKKWSQTLNKLNTFNHSSDEIKDVWDEVQKNKKKGKLYSKQYSQKLKQKHTFKNQTQDRKDWARKVSEVTEKTKDKLENDNEFDWNQLTEDEVNAFKSFLTDSYRDMQYVAMGDRVTMSPSDYREEELKGMIKHLDNITRNHKLKRNTKTYAGIRQKMGKKLKVGETFKNKAFRSTSVSLHMGANFSQGSTYEDTYMLQFNLKKGQPGFYADGKNSSNANHGESEFLLPRNSKLKIVDKQQVYYWPSSFTENGIKGAKPLTIFHVEVDGYEDDEDDPIYSKRKPFSIDEDLKKYSPAEKGKAHDQAMKLGLEYYGFGRYGKKNKITHFSDGDSLKRWKAPRRANKQRPNYRIAKAAKLHSKSETPEDDDKLTSAINLHKDEVPDFNEMKKKSPKKYKFYNSISDFYDKQREKFVDAANDQKEFMSKLNDENRKKVEELRDNEGNDYNWERLTARSKTAIDIYTGSSYRDIQKSLVANKNEGDLPTGYMKEAIKRLDYITRESKLPDDMIVYSGVSQKLAKNLKVGFEFKNAPFRSTTVKSKVGFTFAKSHYDKIVDDMNPEDTPHLIQIDMKKGQPGFFMDGKHNNNTYAGEAEFLLPRNSKLKITGSRKMYTDAEDVDTDNIRKVATVWFAEYIDFEDDPEDFIYKGSSYDEARDAMKAEDEGETIKPKPPINYSTYGDLDYVYKHLTSLHNVEDEQTLKEQILGTYIMSPEPTVTVLTDMINNENNNNYYNNIIKNGILEIAKNKDSLVGPNTARRLMGAFVHNFTDNNHVIWTELVKNEDFKEALVNETLKYIDKYDDVPNSRLDTDKKMKLKILKKNLDYFKLVYGGLDSYK